MSTVSVRAVARGPWILLVPAIVLALVLALVGADSPASAAAGQVTLTGHVTIANGTTPAGAGEVAVHYTNLPSNYAYRYSPSVLTDSSGNFSITGDAGPYTLFFEYLGTSSIASVYWGGPTRYDLTYITANTDVSALNITLPPRAVVAGQVSLGSPGAHPAVAITYRVFVSDGSSFHWDGVQRTAAADGRFSVALDPGLYWLDFSAPGYQTRSWDGVSGSIGEYPTTVRVQDIGGVNPVLPALGSISGHVVLGTASHAAAAGQVKVTYSVPSVSSATSSVLTDANGDYLIPGLSDAQYSLLFEDVADHGFQSTSVSAVTVSRTTPDPVSSVTLVTTGSISGQVLLGSSSRPAGAGEVQISFGGTDSNGVLPPPITTTDATGHWAITGLVAGSYKLFFHYAGSGAFADQYWQNTYSYDTATPTLVSTSVVTRDVTLPASGGITGTLISPIASTESAWVYARKFDESGAQTGEVETVSNTDGTFAFPRLSPGTYRIFIADKGLPPILWQWYHQTPGQAEGETITVTAGSTAALGNIPLVRGAAVSGTVTCAGQCGPSDALNSFSRIEGRDTPTSPWVYVKGTLASASGYGISGLVPGQYRVTFLGSIDYSCAPAVSDPVTLTDGQQLSLPLTVHCGNAGLPPGPPRGSFDAATPTAGGTVLVTGWALDPDSVPPVSVYAYVDGTFTDSFVAGSDRPDIGALYPSYGAAHGYSNSLNALKQGTHTICLIAQNLGPGSNNSLGCRTVTIPNGTPIGSLDSVAAGHGSVGVSGWAFDPDTTDPITVDVYLDGVVAQTVTANGSRPDVGAAYPGRGGDHGYSTTLTGVGVGTHTVCALANNVGGRATSPTIGCRTVIIQGIAPFGSLDSVSASGPGAIALSGWVIDADSTAAMTVHVYLDGALNTALTATGSRLDVAAAFPGNGTTPGYGTTLAGLAAGPHTVCTYAINQGIATINPQLGCRTVTVPGGNPFGSVDTVAAAGPGSIVVGGWAIDPDTANSVLVHVYIDGALITGLTANGARPDVAAVFAGYGAAHGFGATLTGFAGGVHTVCLYAINQLSGTGNPAFGCRTVVLPTGSPRGSFDVAAPATGAIAVSGWAYDPDTTAPILVHFYIDGALAGALTADGSRPDVAAVIPGYGAGHGFSGSFPVGLGAHTVCAYAINQGPAGVNPALGCRAVSVGS